MSVNSIYFKLKENFILKLSPFIIGFILMLTISYFIVPIILYASKDQPFQFSHIIHLEQVADGCNSCHTFDENGLFNGIPTIEICRECHDEEPLGNDKNEIELVKYIKSNTQIPWEVYSRQPDCVFFSHIIHTKANINCCVCHGDHGKSNNIKTYEYNRISGYSRDIWGYSILGTGSQPERMKMDTCYTCHRKNDIRDACFVCHK